MLTSGRFWIGVALGAVACHFLLPMVTGAMAARQAPAAGTPGTYGQGGPGQYGGRRR